MRALVCAPDQPLRVAFRDVPEPSPAADEALIAVRAFSLNLGELRRLAWEVDGWRPGYDVAGAVLQSAADGSGPPPGARVVGLLTHGAWAERVAVGTRYVAPIPPTVDDSAAATIPVAGLTSLAVLAHGGALIGKRVLITGAAGGVGRFAIQLARLAGAHVTASVGRPERATGLDALGAAETVVGLDSDGPAFDLVMESVGGPLLGAALARLAHGGVLVAIGGSSDEPTTFEVLKMVRAGGTSLYGLSLFDELERTGYGRRELGRLLDLMAAGRLDPQIALCSSWHSIEDALVALRERRLAGKAVMLVD